MCIRDSSPDPNAVSSVEAYQVGGALSYWQSANLRFTADVNAYVTPESGSGGSGAVVVPGNLGSPPADGSAHTVEEVGGRVSVMF